MLFGVNLPYSLACKYCKSPEIRKNGLNDRFIINARLYCDCEIAQAKEEIVFYFVQLGIGLVGVTLAVLVIENFSAAGGRTQTGTKECGGRFLASLSSAHCTYTWNISRPFATIYPTKTVTLGVR